MEGPVVKFTIDGKQCEAPEGQNLVKAAEFNGIKIPSLCYYEHIDPPLGTCRVCMVFQEDRPVAACTLKVREGMNIGFNVPALNDARKAMVEMMFAEGNHFCPACEKSGDCDLQGLGYRLGVTASRFRTFFSTSALITALSGSSLTITAASFAAAAWRKSKQKENIRYSVIWTGAPIPVYR